MNPSSESASRPEKQGVSKPRNSSMQAMVKAEKLTQIAVALPAAVFVGWLAGAGLDKLLHQHWIYIAGLLVGAVAGFVQIFRMIADPKLLASTAYDASAAPGPGFHEGSPSAAKKEGLDAAIAAEHRDGPER